MTIVSIDVVIPAKDAAAFLPECLGSVAAQSHVPRQVIVVDDSSSDDTARLAASLGAVVLPSTRPGAGAARNLGARSSTADLVAFLDADDLMAPGRLEADGAALAAAPGAIGVVGRSRRFEDAAEGRRLGPAEAGLLAGAATLRRLDFVESGGFDEAHQAAEFIDFVGRRRADGAQLVTAEHLAFLRRVHGANTTRDELRFAAGLLAVAREAAARQRERP